MGEIKTKHQIGDLVFTARADGVDKDVIKAIKIVGIQKRISYGIEKGQSFIGSWFGDGDKYRWFAGADLFKGVEGAELRQKNLKAREDEKKQAEAKKELLDMEHKLKLDKENLRRKKMGLPTIIEDEYDD